MYNIPLGKTGLSVPTLAVGCMRIGSLSNQDAEHFICSAIEQGAYFFDHADIYGRGECETKFAESYGMTDQKREKIILQSKCGIVPGKILDMPIAANQLQLSITNCTMIKAGLNVNMEIDPAINRDGYVLDYCRLNDITIQPWSPFQYGFFEGTFIDNEKFGPLNDCLEKIAGKYEADKTAIVVAWLLRHPAHFQPIIGTMNEGRLRSCIRGTEIRLTREEWYEIYMSAGNKLP